MFRLAALVSLAAAAAQVAYAAGSAHVVNLCSYDVYLCNVPSAGGGYDEADTTLKSGDSWTQDWTQLTNGNGWSIKLSQTQALENILQYEYTWHDDGIIWYDLSCVNGNPWDGNWEITSSTSSCNPKQQAYRYSTDDAYGMQSCPQDASITVTLCSGEATDNGTYPSDGSDSSSAAPAYTSTSSVVAAAYTSAPAAPAAPVTPLYNWNNADVSASEKPTPTTFATQITQVAALANGAVVDMVETVYVTDIVTAYAAKPKRHEHHPHHRHAN